jgi:soluble P-type ATPase
MKLKLGEKMSTKLKYLDTAIFENYIIAQIEGGTDNSKPIRIFKDTSFIASGDVKGELRNIAKKLGVSMVTSEGGGYPTQSLGNKIMRAIHNSNSA